MTDQAFMIGHLCTSIPHPVRGSVRRACIECRQPVWVTPESLKVAGENRGCIFMCMPCVKDTLSGDLVVQPHTKEQTEELARHREEEVERG